jgi:fumarate reductase flavoprotein subunit
MSSTGTNKAGNLQADVVVMGSGGGLISAVTAAEAGASVILLEKENILGGYTRQANGFFICENQAQKDAMFKRIASWDHWTRVDPRIVRAYVNKSEDTVRWLEKEGVEFANMGGAPNSEDKPAGRVLVGRGNGMQKVLIKKAEEVGVKTLLNTSGKKIRRGPKGNVVGVVAVKKDGEELQIKTRSVIIATGSFGNNRELLKKYCPDYYDGMPLDLWPHREAHSGDGLLMAEAMGAAIADSVPIYHLGPYYPGYMPPYLSLPAMALNRYAMWVNKKGQRFLDEGGFDVWEMGNAILLQPDRIMYSLSDDEMRRNLEERGHFRGHSKEDEERVKGFPGLSEDLRKEADLGKVKISDSWDEIAGWIGADPEVLKAEIEEYNSYCEQGRDEIFAKDREYLIPLRTPPYYAMRCNVRVGETLGGIKINEHMEVLDTQGKVIPGAYAAGVIADGWASQTTCAGAMGFAVYSGRIAGESAAKYVKGN